MIRRDFCKSSLFAAAALPASLAGRPVLASLAPASSPAAPDASCEAVEFSKSPGLTKYVAEFIVNTKYDDIPADVIDLGKKTILDGFGLALAGSVSASGPIIRK